MQVFHPLGSIHPGTTISSPNPCPQPGGAQGASPHPTRPQTLEGGLHPGNPPDRGLGRALVPARCSPVTRLLRGGGFAPGGPAAAGDEPGRGAGARLDQLGRDGGDAGSCRQPPQHLSMLLLLPQFPLPGGCPRPGRIRPRCHQTWPCGPSLGGGAFWGPGAALLTPCPTGYRVRGGPDHPLLALPRPSSPSATLSPQCFVSHQPGHNLG